MTKQICYYYSITTDENIQQYRCLTNDSDDITTMDELDFKTNRLYAMNMNYQAIDSDLIRFRSDLIKHNDDIMRKNYPNKVTGSI